MKKTEADALDESTRLLKAFADPVRLRLLNLLSGDREEVCVCHLHEALGMPQPTVSRHLAYLRKHGLVVGRKEAETRGVSVRRLGSQAQTSLSLDEALAALRDEATPPDVKRAG